ncbi:MAG: class I SAM-dependent methyltransferase [Chthoniobacterales bacterium]
MRAARSRYQGVLQILRFNCPMYVAAAVVLGTGAVLLFVFPLPPLVQIAGLIGIALAAFWLLVSLAVSHYVYDLSGIYRGDWLRQAIRRTPLRATNLHAGFDEFSDVLRVRFPETELSVFDFFDSQRMTEPSIVRARELARKPPGADAVDFRSLPLRDEELDAAFLIFAAHELREPDARVVLLRELRRSLKRDGEMILVEHLRDLPNLIAFGPGFLHFYSRNTWLRAFAGAGLRPTDEFSLTPFVRVFVLEKT